MLTEIFCTVGKHVQGLIMWLRCTW